ncbi:MAG: carboxypeptidase regulatory-like domain-containing protein [Blastocatellia bacterium]|nr:carboxypeptidase regulatory-like domain-containing protein [Blastocatellia bacterium]
MKHRPFSSFSAIPVLLLIALGQTYAQSTQADNRPRTASLSGRVTIGDKPAANAPVMVMETDPKYPRSVYAIEQQHGVYIKVRSDSDGRYSVTGLPPGAYMITALSNAYLPSKSTYSDSSKLVTLDDGEARKGVDLALVRGGVITGRVVDAEGRPIIASRMNLKTVAEDGMQGGDFDRGDWMTLRTDDRGIYRIYGLPAGHYIISSSSESGSGKHRYLETFYPDATDQSGAKIIEVKEGAEVSGIDIRFGLAVNTYEASGRVIDSETGQPVPGVRLSCTGYVGLAKTDDEGRFSIKGLSAGENALLLQNPCLSWNIYCSSAESAENSEYYSEKTKFTISDSDVKDLEVRAIRGSTIKGIVVIEGNNDPAAQARLQQALLFVSITPRPASDTGSGDDGFWGTSRVKGDGSFSLGGLHPGMANFLLRSLVGEFSIKRIEIGSAVIGKDFEIVRGAQIDGVRIFVVDDNGTIRGQVQIRGGRLPEDWQLRIFAAPVNVPVTDGGYSGYQPRSGSAEADEKGRFVIEELPAGEYELTLQPMLRTGANQYQSVIGVDGIKQRVTISRGGEAEVKFVLDLPRQQQEDRQ